MISLDTLTIKTARAALDAREYTAVELAQAYLGAIAEKDGELHAYLEVFDDVIEQAKRADEIISRGDATMLTGIPFAVKDNIVIEGRIASGASKMLEHYKATYDATVIARLKEQGVVFLGRTNMDEFALGSSTENSAFGPTKNPHDKNRVPGGTSGGSAAAVAAGLALAALGSDTGGSIRQPAALCGVVGMKPTYGMVSRFGLMAAASSLDQIGPITRTIEDAALVLAVLRGHDDQDSTSLPDGFFKTPFETKKVIGVPRAFVTKGVDKDVLEQFEAGLEQLKKGGYEIRDVEMPQLAHSLAAYYIINPAEVSTNLARYDGIRYGLSEVGEDTQDSFAKTRAKGFGPETRRRIILGTFVLSEGYADAYYRKALAVRELIRGDFERAFEDVSAIAIPTTPSPAFKLGEKNSDPVAMYAEDIFTVPVNIAGVPAISVPYGSVARDGVSLPVGFQLITAHGNDEALFTIGRALE